MRNLQIKDCRDQPISSGKPELRTGSEQQDQSKLKITNIEPIIVSVPYKHRETSTRVQRDGVRISFMILAH